MVEHLFKGNHFCAVDQAGRMMLPEFARRTLALRLSSSRILLGVHETEPCLVAFDSAELAEVRSDCQRRRMAECATPHQHSFLLRRLFGFMSEVDVRASGRFEIPAILRRRGRIGDAVLVIGTGAALELWNPQVALESGDPDLRELTEFHLDTRIAA
jgi:MraZ protein